MSTEIAPTEGTKDSVRSETGASGADASVSAHPGSETSTAVYKVVCISIYNSDLARLDERVKRLKALGWTKANRSHLIRIALAELTDDQIADIAGIEKARR